MGVVGGGWFGVGTWSRDASSSIFLSYYSENLCFHEKQSSIAVKGTGARASSNPSSEARQPLTSPVQRPCLISKAATSPRILHLSGQADS